MNHELLSVIVPVYNVEEYLNVCIDSIINQTYHNVEIILVDDGSTDSSGKICDTYAILDERVKVIHQKNKGLIGARYAGLCEAGAEYITFVDSDDFIDEKMYSDLMKIVTNYKADMITSGCYRYREKDDYSIDVCSRMEEGLYTYEDMKKKVFPVMFWEEKTGSWAVDPSLCMKIVKKDFLLKQYEKIKNFSFYYGEDSAVIYPAILQMSSIYITHNCYYFHRQPARGSVRSYIVSEDFLSNLMVLYNYLYDEFKNKERSNVLIRQLDFFFIKSVGLIARRYPEVKFRVGATREWLFPFGKVKGGSKIVLYGAGAVGRQYWNQLKKTGYCKEVMWVDKNAHLLEDKNVHSPLDAVPDEYDFIVIAIKDKDLSGMIMQDMILRGWDETQIVIPDFEC